MMLVAILFCEEVANSLDRVELVIIGSFDKGRHLSVDSSVCGRGCIVHLIWAYSDNISYTVSTSQKSFRYRISPQVQVGQHQSQIGGHYSQFGPEKRKNTNRSTKDWKYAPKMVLEYPLREKTKSDR